MQMPSRFLKELPQDQIAFEEVYFGAEFLFNKRSENAAQRYVAPVQQRTKIEDGILGKRVFHQKFGYGKVLSSDGNKLEISFEKSGTKIVMKDFVTFA
jgi:hypothetical protein